MTWRAFLIGVFLVAVVAAVTPINDYYVINTYITGIHFPPGPFFLMLLLTLVVNVLIKLVDPRRALRQAELMLIWCMLIVASTVPASGLMRYWLPMMASPAYFADSPDLSHQDEVLEATPEALVVSKNPQSVAVRRFYEGRRPGEKVRIYFKSWVKPIAVWLIFIGFFYLATFFMGGMLRKQWVEVERLIFPLARVPLELTEGSGQKRLLPEMFHQAPFLVGLALTLLFALIRVAPVFLGKAQGWLPSFPLASVLANTPLHTMAWFNAEVYPLAIGVAFLVPADVTLSVWVFFWMAHFEVAIADWIGKPLRGGYFGGFMHWQQVGSFVACVMMVLWAARRHLRAVVKKAFGRGRGIDDGAEPVSYALSFWGLLLAVAGMIGWFMFWGMKPLTALLYVALLMCLLLVQARVISQGGILFTLHHFSIPVVVNGMTGGAAFGSSPAGQAAVVAALLQYGSMADDSREIISGHAFNAFRISSVFEKRRRWFLPIMLVALMVAIGVCVYASLRMYYMVGANNANQYGTVSTPINNLRNAGAIISDPTGSAESH
ncbi:MAG: hypothetical protein J7M08_03125, partial [Planctomycetes bacterium]|nr:hypothetical protein [Planctomycetota bacterium]